MALKSGALTTTERVKDKLAIDNTNQDDVLERIINSITSFIETRCNRDHGFKESSISQEVYNGSGTSRHKRQFLILNQAPVDSISDFQYRAGTKTSPNWTDFIENNYELINPDSGIVKVGGGLPMGERNLRISYTAGYKIDFDNPTTSTHTLPHELTDMAERLVVKFYKRRDDDGRQSVSMNTTTVEFAQYLDPIDQEVLANYNRAYARL